MHCAHVEPPSGGPVDTTPPYASEVYPAPGGTHVSPDAVFKLRFSEWIDRDAGRGRVLLSPPLPGKLKVTVDGDRLLIHPPSPLQPNTAYRLTVLGSLKDLHGVAMGKAFSLAFTTGEGFDSGKVSGKLFTPEKGVGTFAALYRMTNRDSSSVLPRSIKDRSGFHPDSLPSPWSELPASVTPADSNGSFVFDSVPQGRYAVFTYEDVNGNLTPDIGFEPVGIGSLELNLTSHTPDQFLGMTLLDTLPLRVSAIRFVGDTATADSIRGSLRLKFTHDPNIDSIRNLGRWLIRGSSKNDSHSFGVSGIGWDAAAKEWVLELPPLQRDVHYHLTYRGVPDTGIGMIPEFTASSSSDTVAWTLSFLNPEENSGKSSVLSSSELIPGKSYRLLSNRLLTQVRFSLLERKLEARLDTLPVKSSLHRTSPMEFSIELGDSLKAGQAVTLSLPPPEKKPGTTDTLRRVLVSGRALDAGRLGGLHFEIPDVWKGWTFLLQNTATSVEFTVKPSVSGSSIDLGPLPTGAYRLSAFQDRDGNGIWFPGSLRPWKEQEPVRVLLDWVNVTGGPATDATPLLSGSRAFPSDTH